jgi:hypothetical protein
MKAARLAAGVLAATIASAALLALPAGAHQAEGEPSVNCDEVSVKLKSFPNTPTTITFHITVNGGPEQTKTDEFTGPSGTASASISDLTTATGPLDITAFATWFADGSNGESKTAEVEDEVCHETPTESSVPTEVGGAEATRPETTQPAVATAVAATPRFTG